MKSKEELQKARQVGIDNFVKNLKSLMEQHYIGTTSLAYATGLSPSIISLYLSGERQPTPKSATLIARHFNIEVSCLFREDGDIMRTLSMPKSRRAEWSEIPYLSWENSLKWKNRRDKKMDRRRLEELMDNRLMLVVSVGGLDEKESLGFWMRVPGDAMVNPTAGEISFNEGSTIVVDATKKPEPGEFVLAFHPNYTELLLRKYLVDGGKKYLEALNPDYPRLEIQNVDQLEGVVVQKIEWTVSG